MDDSHEKPDAALRAARHSLRAHSLYDVARALRAAARTLDAVSDGFQADELRVIIRRLDDKRRSIMQEPEHG